MLFTVCHFRFTIVVPALSSTVEHSPYTRLVLGSNPRGRTRFHKLNEYQIIKMKKVIPKGFTLIELLVVISVIGLLSSVVLVSLNSARLKAKDAAIIQSMVSLRGLYEQSYMDKGYVS